MEENTFGDFYKEEFDIDEFLNKQTETNELKEILYSLNEMKNKNANQMTTVLREKTDAVILIAEQLQSLYKKIDNLQSPLAQLKEEVQIVTTRVHDTVHAYDKTESYYQDINKTKADFVAIRAYKVVITQTQQLLKILMNQDDVDFDTLERLVCKYAFHAFVLNKLNIVDTSDTKKPSIDISIKLILRDSFLKAHSAGNSDKVMRIIDMFVYLGMLDMLKEIVCDDIVKPKVAPVFCEENLRACGNDMSLVYAQALRVLQHDLKLLNNIIRTENINLDIILDCYWNVVDKLLRTNLISITAAGHPDAFFKHFNHTHEFLQEIGVIHGNRELYKQHHSFIEHLKRFNLLVYYEIRHQYVSSSFELVIIKSSEFSDVEQLEKVCTTKTPIGIFKLKSSLALNILIEYLFGEKVFMSIISEQFAKSAMLLTARYSNWVQKCLMSSLVKYPRSQKNITIAVYLISDLQLLTKFLPENYKKIDSAIDNNIRNALESKLQEDFGDLYKEVSDYLINYHLNKIKDDLKNVSDIPRLYRKTNRSVPQQASSYVKDAFKEIEILSKMLQNEEKQEGNQRILLKLLQSATNEYNSMVHGVLNAVFKTEESLKRLKSRNVTSNESGVSQGSSDEAKIRLQIKLDVKQFVQSVNSFKLSKLDGELEALLVQIENC